MFEKVKIYFEISIINVYKSVNSYRTEASTSIVLFLIPELK